ncbi:MAG: single-stranded DNA-binding protein [Halobacteriovoraceae bacterium]|jgi:single-strand DNA-binding protein|nr:single-stranded DNA-binding protein [Halobacteriovoraceae bacterium]
MSFSQIVIIGHIGNEPELKYTKNQTAILNLSIGVPEKLSPRAPMERKPKTYWHKCRRWGKNAEQLKTSLRKGDKLFIKGTLIYESWQDKTGSWHKDAIIEIEYSEKMYFENISIDLDSFK